MRDEDIFYSDEEFSDSEDLYQVSCNFDLFSRSWSSRQVPDYQKPKPEGSIFYQHGGSGLIENNRSNTIDHPVNQISSGMAGMGLGGNFLNQARLLLFLYELESISSPAGIMSIFLRPTIKTQEAPKSLSYSSMAKKEPLQPIKPNIIKSKFPPVAIHRAEPKKQTAPSIRVAETALDAGYRCPCFEWPVSLEFQRTQIAGFEPAILNMIRDTQLINRWW